MYIYSLKEIIHYSDRFDITDYKWAKLLGVSRKTVRHTLDGECFTKMKAIAMSAIIDDMFMNSCVGRETKITLHNRRKDSNRTRKTINA